MKGIPDPRPFELQIPFGSARGTVPWFRPGFNGDVDAGEEDVWTVGGTYVYPTGNRMEFVSSSAQDAAAGTGIQQVQFHYLDTSYNEQSEIVTLNGAGAVGTVAVNILRVQGCQAYRVGATIPAAAAGTITMRLFGGGTTYSEISQGYTRCRNAFYTVPAGKVLYMTHAAFSSGSAAGLRITRFTLRATYDNSGSGRLLGANFFMPYSEVQIQDSGIDSLLEVPTMFPATTDIKVSVTSDDTNASCACFMRGFLQTLGVA